MTLRFSHFNHNWSLRLSTLLVLSLCFFLLSGSWLVAQNFQRLLSFWGEEIPMSVDISGDSSNDQVEKLQSFLQQSDGVSGVQFLDREKTAESFRQQMAGVSSDLFQDLELLQLINPSFVVKFSSKLSGDSQLKLMEDLAHQLKSNPAVVDVSYGQEWAQRYTHLVGLLRGIALAIALVLVFSSLFVISNVIQNSVTQKRLDIEVLELLGATSSMIRWPFLLEGALVAFGAMVLALTMTFLSYSWMLQKFSQEIAFFKFQSQLQGLDWRFGILALVFASLWGSLSSFLCVRKINTGWSAAQRKLSGL